MSNVGDPGPREDPNGDAELHGLLLEFARSIRGVSAHAEQAKAEIEDEIARMKVEPEPADSDNAGAVAELAGSVAERMAAMREECDQLSLKLEQAADLMTEALASTAPGPQAPAERPPVIAYPRPAVPPAAPPAPDPPPAAPLPPPAPSEPSTVEHDAAPQQDGPPARVSDGMRMITTQAAVAGSSREEIEERLRSEFGVSEPHDIVEEVLGPE